MEMISIIIPTFNAEKYIKKCLDSVIAQSYNNIEVIVVDDGSSDETGSIVKDYAVRDTRIKYFYKENGGSSDARNYGLSVSSGELITFADSDDYMESDYCKVLIEGIHKYNADLCSCRATDHHLANEGDDRNFPEDDNPTVINIENFSFFNDRYPKGSVCVLFKRELISGISFAKDIFVGEDTLFFAQALHKAKNIVMMHKNLYHYIIYDESTCHGSYDRKKRTEFVAWKRIAKVFKDIPNVYFTCRARYADRCLKVIRKYHFNLGVNYNFYKKMVKEYRKNVKYIIKCSMKKHHLVDFVSCSAYILFALFPSLYPKYYKFRYNEIS